MATNVATAQTLNETAAAAPVASKAAVPAASLLLAARLAVTARASGRTDPRRAWLWWFLVLLVASQLYFVRELVAAFALFAIAFAAVAFVVGCLYMLSKASVLAIARLAELRQPAMTIAAVPSEQRKAA
ncbi:MAG TPA: hypothetical protein VE263_09725 [Candidatus Angelobacter sp.]|nr:hypothetical protein [Candidatus Angelobacter sp.]